MKTKFFWAYARNAKNKCVLVKCDTVQDAREEGARLKMSDAKTVGVVSVKYTEQDMRNYAKGNGWTVTTVRNPGSYKVA